MDEKQKGKINDHGKGKSSILFDIKDDTRKIYASEVVEVQDQRKGKKILLIQHQESN